MIQLVSSRYFLLSFGMNETLMIHEVNINTASGILVKIQTALIPNCESQNILSAGSGQ